MGEGLVAECASQDRKGVGQARDGDKVLVQDAPVDWDWNFPEEEDGDVGEDDPSDGSGGLRNVGEEACVSGRGCPVLGICV